MIVKNTKILYFLLLIFLFANALTILSYGSVSIFAICFQILLVSLYIIFRPNKIQINKCINIYYLLPKRLKEICSNQVIHIRVYQQGLYGGGGYLIKITYFDKKGKRKTATLLESISEKKKAQLIELFKSYDFNVIYKG